MDHPDAELIVGNLFAAPHMLILLLTYLVVIGVVGAALYFVVRLAVLHAMKSHTRWVDQGKP